MSNSPDRLTITVTLPDGKEYRWAADERDVQNVPSGLGFSTSVPGGFSTCTFSLPRDVIKDYPDEALFADVKITGAGGVVAWEGRVAQLPREHGSSRSVTVGAVGWSAHLKDDQTFREIYRDSVFSNWGSMPIARQAQLIAAGYTDIHDPGVVRDSSSGPAMNTVINRDKWDSTHKPISEAWYDSHGIPIGSLYYAWKRNAGAIDNTQVDWVWSTVLSADETHTSSDVSGDLRAAGPSGGTLTATTSTRRYATAQVYYEAAGGTTDQTVAYSLLWTALNVYGTHGLTKRGTEPSAGFYMSDIVPDVLERAAPLLTVGDIESTSYVIPQAAYTAPTDAESVILDLNKYELKRFGVWEDRRFDMWTANADTRTVWEARLSDGATLQLEGDSTDSTANGVVVYFTEPLTQQQLTVGPTGYSPADATSDALLITDTSNPATAAGINQYRTLTLSFPTDASGAEQVGAVWLREQQLPQRRGSVTVTGKVRRASDGVEFPAWAVRAGDFVRVADRPSDPPREITATSYSHDSHTNTLSVGGLPNTTEALLERVGVRTGNF